jgi:hypothetical protein
VAEGRALRRHGNRTEIIYRGRQVPTLDPESTGDMRFGMRNFYSSTPEPLFPFPGERGFGFLGEDFLRELCESLAIFAVKSF